MKIQKEVLLLNITAKKKQDGSDYLSVGFATVDDGMAFTVSSTNMDFLNTLEPFNKYLFELVLSDSKYGLKLTLNNVIN